MRATYLAVCVCFIAVAVLVTNAVSSDSLDRAQLAERMVGQETPPSNIPPPKCCKKPELTTCDSDKRCETIPNCAPGRTIDETCGQPSCIDTYTPNSICSGPFSSKTTTVQSCRTTGKTLTCTSPINTSKCETTFLINLSINNYGCNAGDTLCANQPTDVCN